MQYMMVVSDEYRGVFVRQGVFASACAKGRITSLILFALMLVCCASSATGGDKSIREAAGITGSSAQAEIPACPQPADQSEAVAEWCRRAVRGDTGAQADLGLLHLKGQCISRNASKTYIWFSKAATAGDLRAQSNLGFMYQRGIGVSQNYSRARAWLEKAAVRGSISSHSNLGLMYRHGWGAPRDNTQAARWYGLAAAQGNPNAEENLGNLFAAGEGVPESVHSQGVA